MLQVHAQKLVGEYVLQQFINMEPRKENRIEQCLNGIQKYEKWGNLLAGQSWVHLFNSNVLVNASAQ